MRTASTDSSGIPDKDRAVQVAELIELAHSTIELAHEYIYTNDDLSFANTHRLLQATVYAITNH
jgi:hypothetical protein